MEHSTHVRMTLHSAAEDENEYFYEWLKHSPGLREREDQIVRADQDKDIETVSAVLSLRKFYIQKYAHAIPTNTALTAIADFAPIIEIGAGTGYWAFLLRRRGVDIICYDRNPPGSADGSNRFHEGATCWTDVSAGDDSAIDLHPSRALLLCWPPPHDEMPLRALRRFRGQYFIYIGELPTDVDGCLYVVGPNKPIRKGVTISHAFFEELQQGWELQRCLELPHWEICWDNLYAFKRRARLGHKES